MQLQRLNQTLDYYINSDAYLMHGLFYTEKLDCKSSFEFFFTFFENLQFLLVNSVSQRQLGRNTLYIHSLKTKAKRACDLGSFILVDVLGVLHEKQGFLGLFDDVRSDGMFYCVIEEYDLFFGDESQPSLVEKIYTGERVSYADTTRSAMLQKIRG